MTGTRIDGQYVRRWLDSFASNIPLSELAKDWSDGDLLKWFLALYDRPDSGMGCLYISNIDIDKMKVREEQARNVPFVCPRCYGYGSADQRCICIDGCGP